MKKSENPVIFRVTFDKTHSRSIFVLFPEQLLKFSVLHLEEVLTSIQ